MGERVPKPMLPECYRMTCRKKIDTRLAEGQTDVAAGLRYSHEERVHQGRWCCGRPPKQTFLATIPLAKEKVFAASTLGPFSSP